MITGRTRFSLFYRLLFSFLAVVVIISGILTAVFYVFNKNSQERQIREQTLGAISAIYQSFHYQIQESTIKDLKLLVSNPKLNDFITSSALEKDIILLSVEKLFMKFINNEPGYRHIYFVDSMGMETIKVDRNGPVRTLHNIKRNPLFRQIASDPAGHIHIDEPRIGSSGYPSFTIGIHKTDDDIGQFGGAVMIDATLESFFKYLEGVRIFGENPVWVFGPDGKVLNRPPNQAATFDPAPYLKKEYRDKPECMMVKDGILAYQDFAVVPGKPFARVALSIPSAVLLKDTRTTTKLFVMIFLLSTLLASAISLYLSRYLSRPITELAAASRRLAEGDLSTHVKIKTTGEVQMLVDSFNQMADDLQATTVSKDYMDNIIHSMADSLIVCDRDMTIKTVNQALIDLLGYRKDELVGTRFETILAEGDAATPKESLDEGCMRNSEMVYRTREGKLIPMLVTGSVIANKKGDITGHVLIGKDITDRKRAEEDLREANDTLNATLQASPAAILTLNHDGIVTSWNDAAERIFGWSRGEIIGSFNPLVPETGLDDFKSMRERVRDGGTVKKTISISETIRESANFALRGSNVRCEFDLADKLWYADADEGQISQVIQNLVINANQAMPGGGKIQIRAGNAVLDGASGVPLPEGKYVKVVIEDHGTGIPNEHLPKIFDPYFTTKQKGSGLGLAIVYSIIRSHGGYVKVSSTNGVGTTFTLYLPVSDRHLAEDKPSGEEVMSGKGKILLMDDEEMVRDVVGAMLKEAGYEVEYAKDGAEAIDHYVTAGKSGKPFSAVIMDLTIPGGMGGLEAIRHLRHIDSDVKAIVSSGYSDHPVMANFRKHGFSAVIPKPFRISELSRTLKHVQDDAWQWNGPPATTPCPPEIP
jgi:PAS domain S-box-containing protein